MALINRYSGWRIQTSSSSSDNSIDTLRKTTSEKTCKIERDLTVGSKVMFFYTCYSGLTRTDLLFIE
jgi:hypothetical protein